MCITQEGLVTSVIGAQPIVVLLSLGLASCAAQAPAGSLPPPGSIRGTVYFEGPEAEMGPLAIAVYASFPPKGPPAATQLHENVRFPYAYSVDNLQPGSWYVGALIDFDKMDTAHVGMLNQDVDPFGYFADGGSIDVEDAGAMGADIFLERAQ